ncbi:MAG: putative immunity protein [Nocardioides sp.]|uniref:putative immunity protein n=1 Tax=Nocardioides sp. TaxID=35761 RepID=UPI003F0687E2
MGAVDFDLSLDEIREVTAWAADRAADVLATYERAVPGDRRPATAIAAARAFADGGPRLHVLRKIAMDAHRAGMAAVVPEAGHAALSASQAAAAAFLHPLPKAHQVKHLLGSAAYAVLARGEAERDLVLHGTPAVVRHVLARYPLAPEGGGAVGAVIRDLDAALRR